MCHVCADMLTWATLHEPAGPIWCTVWLRMTQLTNWRLRRQSKTWEKNNRSNCQQHSTRPHYSAVCLGPSRPPSPSGPIYTACSVHNCPQPYPWTHWAGPVRYKHGNDGQDGRSFLLYSPFPRCRRLSAKKGHSRARPRPSEMGGGGGE
jgi:hypothetical protein